MSEVSLEPGTPVLFRTNGRLGRVEGMGDPGNLADPLVLVRMVDDTSLVMVNASVLAPWNSYTSAVDPDATLAEVIVAEQPVANALPKTRKTGKTASGAPAPTHPSDKS